jgi:hypothetical protein
MIFSSNSIYYKVREALHQQFKKTLRFIFRNDWVYDSIQYVFKKLKWKLKIAHYSEKPKKKDKVDLVFMKIKYIRIRKSEISKYIDHLFFPVDESPVVSIINTSI